MRVREGEVAVEVPEQSGEGVGREVFFNPRMELNRDLTVATLRAYGDRCATYLDATAATGIRGVRAAKAGYDVTLADVDPEAVERCRANLARNDLDGEVVHRDANAVLYDRPREFDVVDVDPFGTPIPFADAALRNAGTLVCVTATDTAPLCGAHFESGVRKYGALPLNTEYHAEMGLRVLLSALARTAARYDVAVDPVFSHVSDHYVRTYLELHDGAAAADEVLDELGHLYHCWECLWRTHDPGLLADAPEACPVCGATPATAGPVWLGATSDPDTVAAVASEVDATMGTARRAERLLERVGGELDTPTHYDQHRLCEEWGVPANAMDDFLADLRDAGYPASRTQYGGTTFKTTATVEEIRAAAAPEGD